MIKNKFMALTLTVLLTAGMLTGCGSGDKEKDKDAYRQYGINCIENGSYDDAVDAFQKALDQSVGSVGAEELDICYYKAKAQYLSGDVDGAIDTYTAIIDYNKDSDAYYLRAVIVALLLIYLTHIVVCLDKLLIDGFLQTLYC